MTGKVAASLTELVPAFDGAAELFWAVVLT